MTLTSTMRCQSSSGCVGRLVEQHHAGVVDHRVEPAELVDGAPDRLRRLLAVGDVGLDREHPPARLLDLRGERVEPVLAPRGDRDRRARARQRPRRRLADAAAGAGDQRNRSVKSFSHGAHGDRLGGSPPPGRVAGPTPPGEVHDFLNACCLGRDPVAETGVCSQSP